MLTPLSPRFGAITLERKAADRPHDYRIRFTDADAASVEADSLQASVTGENQAEVHVEFISVPHHRFGPQTQLVLPGRPNSHTRLFAQAVEEQTVKPLKPTEALISVLQKAAASTPPDLLKEVVTSLQGYIAYRVLERQDDVQMAEHRVEHAKRDVIYAQQKVDAQRSLHQQLTALLPNP
jgi:hypothetical protein